MRRRPVFLAAAGLVAAAVLGTTVPASASTSFAGAGFTVSGVQRMTVTWRVPALHCMKTENADAIVFGLMGPAVGTMAGWNAVSVGGCYHGNPWYRIQTWVNADGGGHDVAAATAGDLIVARLSYGATSRPVISVQNFTHPGIATWRLHGPTSVVAPGAYAGAQVPKFDNPTMMATANGGKPIFQLAHARHIQYKGSTKQIGSDVLWPDGKHYRVLWRHH